MPQRQLLLVNTLFWSTAVISSIFLNDNNLYSVYVLPGLAATALLVVNRQICQTCRL